MRRSFGILFTALSVVACLILAAIFLAVAVDFAHSESPEVYWVPVCCYDNGDRIWDALYRYVPIHYTVEDDNVAQPPFELMKYDRMWNGHWEQPCLGGTCVWETKAWDHPSYTIPAAERGRPHTLRMMVATDNAIVSVWSAPVTWYPDGWQFGGKRLMPPVINEIR